MKKSEQIKNLETGKGAQYLLDEAYRVLGNPIVMFDTYYSLIAYTKDSNDDPLWNTLVTTGTFSMTEQEFFSEERFTEAVANADKMVVMKSAKLKYDRILGNVFNSEKIKVANIVMVECKSAFEADTQQAFEILADRISFEIRNDKHYTEFGRTYHDTMINKILNGEISDTVIYTPHVQILYDGFFDYLYLAAVDINRNEKTADNLIYFRDLLRNEYPSFKFAVYNDYVLMIMSSKYYRFSSEILPGTHGNPFEQHNLYAGISGSFENLYELSGYYGEATTALKNRTAENGRRIFLYDND